MKLLKEVLQLGIATTLHTWNWLDYQARPNRYRRGW